MRFLRYLDATLPCRTFRTVEYEERQQRLREKLCKSIENEAKLRVLASATALRVKEPDTGIRTRLRSLDSRVTEHEPSIYTDTVSSQARDILLEAIDNR